MSGPPQVQELARADLPDLVALCAAALPDEALSLDDLEGVLAGVDPVELRMTGDTLTAIHRHTRGALCALSALRPGKALRALCPLRPRGALSASSGGDGTGHCAVGDSRLFASMGKA